MGGAPPRSASPGNFSSLEMWLCASLSSRHCQSRRVKLLTFRFFCDSKLIREQVGTSYFVGLVFFSPISSMMTHISVKGIALFPETEWIPSHTFIFYCKKNIFNKNIFCSSTFSICILSLNFSLTVFPWDTLLDNSEKLTSSPSPTGLLSFICYTSLFLCVWDKVLLCSSDSAGTLYVDQAADIECTEICLPVPPECWS